MPIAARFTASRYTIETVDGKSCPVYWPADKYGCPEFYSDDKNQYDTVPELADAIRNYGCTSWCGSWFVSPDGSHIVDYGTYELEEPAVFVESKLKPRQLDRLIALVSGD